MSSDNKKESLFRPCVEPTAYDTQGNLVPLSKCVFNQTIKQSITMLPHLVEGDVCRMQNVPISVGGNIKIGIKEFPVNIINGPQDLHLKSISITESTITIRFHQKEIGHNSGVTMSDTVN